jgi:putative chitinase
MDEFGIDTPLRQAAFVAQIAHESGSLRYVRELASGAAYEGRGDLGNTQPGDGIKFKGRGLIQITGRSNYRACSVALFGDERLLQTPALLENMAPACRSAAWFWKTHGLNQWADAEDFTRITRIINGGVNGLADRLAFYVRAKGILCQPTLEE